MADREVTVGNRSKSYRCSNLALGNRLRQIKQSLATINVSSGLILSRSINRGPSILFQLQQQFRESLSPDLSDNAREYAGRQVRPIFCHWSRLLPSPLQRFVDQIDRCAFGDETRDIIVHQLCIAA